MMTDIIDYLNCPFRLIFDYEVLDTYVFLFKYDDSRYSIGVDPIDVFYNRRDFNYGLITSHIPIYDICMNQ